MNTLFFLAFRNFIRQKRRNLLLGTAIAFGTLVLTVSFAFTEGLTDTLLNRVVVFVSGHIQLNVVERGRIMSPVIRDKNRVIALIKNQVFDIKSIHETVGTYCRAVGNGKSDYVYLVGLEMDKSFQETFTLRTGSFTSFMDHSVPNPVLVSEKKAKALNVAIGDAIQLRFLTVNGQTNTCTLTIVGILNSQNAWMDYAIFTPQKELKALLGYKPYEAGGIQLILHHPKNAQVQADRLWKALSPKPAFIKATLEDGSEVYLAASKSSALPIPSHNLLVSQAAARTHHWAVGQDVTLRYLSQFEGEKVLHLAIGKLTSSPTFPPQILWLDPDTFFDLYTHALPKSTPWPFDKQITKWVCPEWDRLEQTSTTTDYNKKLKNAMKTPQNQPILNVATLFEIASMFVTFEKALNAVAFIGASILLALIMIGVLNSLQLSIKERTQEIGTLRAIGMKKRHIVSLFLYEILCLAVSGWLVGVLTSLALMAGLSVLHFSPQNALSMIMVDHHLYFIPTLVHQVEILGLLLSFSLITAYFPARNAASLDPAIAFQHMKG